MAKLFKYLLSPNVRKDVTYFPLKVIAENANTKAVFSETVCLAVKPYVFQIDTSAGIGLEDNLVIILPDMDLYPKTFELLKSVDTDSDARKDLKPDIKEAVDKCKEYFRTFNKEHEICLKKLVDDEGELPEKDILCVYATHVFEPLLTKSQILLDNEVCRSSACPYCQKQEDNIFVKSTDFGPTSLWHGRADIIIRHENTSLQQIVSIDRGVGDDDTDLDEDTSDKDGKTRCSAGGDDEITDEEEEYLAGIVEEKSDIFGKLFTFGEEETKKLTSQMLAQTIVNAFHVSGNCHELKDVFIPSFLASRQGVLVTMYNTGSDILLSQDTPMKLFDNKGNLQQITFFTIWLMLNFETFQDDAIKSYKDLDLKSEFLSQLNPQSHSLYKCCDPVVKKRKGEAKYISAKTALMDEDIKSLKLLKKSFSN